MQIAKRYCGPPTSGNGGYTCGLLAEHVDGPAVVRLHRPPPLETELHVEPGESGVGSVALFDDDTLIAEARPTSVSLDIPEPPSFSQAERASRGFPGFDRHPFVDCFVCGPARKPGDGMRLFAGPLDDAAIVATPWVPDASLCDESGVARPEFVWAALDCPGGFTFTYPEEAAILLGQMAGDLRGSVRVGERCVVIGWELSHAGRKHIVGTALLGAGGEPVAVAEAIWLEVGAQTR